MHKKLDVKLIQQDRFVNKRSYEAAVWCAGILNKIIERTNKGDFLFEYENIITPAFEMNFYTGGGFEGIYIRNDENCITMIVGDETIGDLIYCTKKNLKEFFKLWRIAKIVNVSKVTDLTK